MPDNPALRLSVYDQRREANHPGRSSVPVTKSDSTTYDPPLLSLRVDGAGDVKFDDASGNTDTWTCAAGEIIPVLMTKVYATGTTATGLHGIQ